MARRNFDLNSPKDVDEIRDLLMNDESKDPAENEDLGEESDIDEMDEVEQNEGDLSTEQESGVYKSNCQRLKEFWEQNGDGIKTFALVMSTKRLKILIRCLRFDDRTTRSKRKG
ncbi:hypothetical protein ILUMI_03969 [Ignelater luminosus]|uniref:PiggyBac transposable element-derived protein domain-containing protein n=1 Tax=Ignelater luminosus TaxID=2038154 RepID=A0A8K0GHT3_IGNLU|nr:hypothetical protein ILUMI_03969 [Ignelater luminosus]